MRTLAYEIHGGRAANSSFCYHQYDTVEEILAEWNPDDLLFHFNNWVKTACHNEARAQVATARLAGLPLRPTPLVTVALVSVKDNTVKEKRP